MPEYGDAVIDYYDDEAYEDMNNTTKVVRNHIYKWLNSTKERYEMLLSKYDAAIDDLMAQLSSTTKVRNDGTNSGTNSANGSSRTGINDTPQSPTDDENYLNSITATTTTDSGTNSGTTHNEGFTETTSDIATPMARLDEIAAKWRNLYEDWCDEFEQFVINSALLH